MADPFTIAGLIGAAFDWSVSHIGETGARALKDRLAKRASKDELVEIATRSVEAAAVAVPTMAGLLRSEAYVNNVLAPGILDILRDPGDGLSSAKLAKRFIDRFVTPYITRGDLDDTIRAAFQVEPSQVDEAFDRLIEALRRELLSSNHWREPISIIATEEMRLGVLSANRKLDDIQSGVWG